MLSTKNFLHKKNTLVLQSKFCIKFQNFHSQLCHRINNHQKTFEVFSAKLFGNPRHQPRKPFCSLQ